MSEPLIDIGRFRLFFWQEWTQFWHTQENNWFDVHFLWLHGEIAPYKDSVEINVGVLGLCVSMDWFYGQYPPREEA